MSTKTTIAGRQETRQGCDMGHTHVTSPGFHLYEDCDVDDHVFIEITDGRLAEVAIPLDVFREILAVGAKWLAKRDAGSQSAQRVPSPTT